VTRIDLVRHGHVENPQRKVYGRLPGWKLSADGRRQAAEVADHLRARPIVHVYASPLERAVETATAIADAHGLAVTTDPALIESALGAHWEGLSWVEVRTARHDELDAYLHRPHEVDFVDEPFAALGQRMATAIRTIAQRHADQEAVIVSHGDPIKAAVCHLMGTAIADMHALKVPTGSLLALEIGGDAVRIVERWAPRAAKH
jgi:broad specificity phosphatase PhoE